MKIIICIIGILTFFINGISSDHGIYLQTVANIEGDISSVKSILLEKIQSSEYNILADLEIKTPDYVREDTSEYCGFSTSLLILTSDKYSEFLVGYGNKYLVAGFLRVGLYETPSGVQINMANPETINRIVFNDLEDKEYAEVVEKSKMFRKELVELTQSIGMGDTVETEMEPIRDDEDLREASRDMFMMVGPLTFFQDEDQFPLIYSIESNDGEKTIQSLYTEMRKNLSEFTPDEDDQDYRWSPSESDLQWKIVAELTAPDSKSMVLGITRPRTEAVSFYIAGKSREEDDNYCPGIDHVTAYPIEILIIEEENKINVYSAREMLRMDMYFWDAGQWAFMDHMQMPGILDESIKRAFFGEIEE